MKTFLSKSQLLMVITVASKSFVANYSCTIKHLKRFHFGLIITRNRIMARKNQKPDISEIGYVSRGKTTCALCNVLD